MTRIYPESPSYRPIPGLGEAEKPVETTGVAPRDKVQVRLLGECHDPAGQMTHGVSQETLDYDRRLLEERRNPLREGVVTLVDHDGKNAKSDIGGVAFSPRSEGNARPTRPDDNASPPLNSGAVRLAATQVRLNNRISIVQRHIYEIAAGQHPYIPLARIYPQDDDGRTVMAFIDLIRNGATAPLPVPISATHLRTFAEAVASKKGLPSAEMLNLCIIYVQKQAAHFLELQKYVARAAQRLPLPGEDNRVMFDKIASKAVPIMESVGSMKEFEQKVETEYLAALVEHFGSEEAVAQFFDGLD